METGKILEQNDSIKKQKVFLTEYQKLMGSISPKSKSEDFLTEKFNAYISERIIDHNVNPFYW